MNDQIEVSVVEFSDRKFFMLQWVDPATGRKRTRSSKVERTGRKRERNEAERVASELERELQAGREAHPNKLTWAAFRERYEMEVLPSLATTTDRKVAGVFNSLEAILPKVANGRLQELTAERLSYFQSQLRKMERSESTIKGHLAHLKAALNWATRVGLLAKTPRIQMPKRPGTAKGRPITTEEFERLLDKTPEVVGIEAAPSWQHYLTGLWWGGLRLAESLDLWWDRDDRLCIDLTGHHPMLAIPGELEKGGKDRLLPIAPEFAEFLFRTPGAERTGPVFNPLPRRAGSGRLSSDRVSRLVSDIGKAAGVKVATHPKTGKVKYASAHDFRRSFGDRWSRRIMPPDLMTLMRHESIDTTMRFYVGRNAQSTAATLWAAYSKTGESNTLSNTPPISSPALSQ